MLLIAFIKIIFIFISTLYFNISEEVEKSIVFTPSKQMHPLIIDAEINNFSTNDNLKLSYLHIKGSKKSPIILFCHGNDGNFTLKKLQRKLIFLADKGYEIFVIDYRGYGQSEGKPYEQGVYSDVRNFIKYLGNFNIKPENIVLWGHSLGAAIVIEIAQNTNFKGVIAEGGFTSIEDMRDYRIAKSNDVMQNFIYNALVISQNFNSKAKVASIKSPMLILHGKRDKVVPYEMGVELAKLNKNAESFFSETGAHNDINWQNETILEFIEGL